MNMYQPSNLLITGGSGFIGSNFIHYLLAGDPQVQIVNLDRLTYAGSKTNLDHISDPRRYHFIHGDISDPGLIQTILDSYMIDTVIHFAAESHVDRSILGPAPFIHTNVMGTFVLLEATRTYWLDQKGWGSENCRFHHISTDEVFGSLDQGAPPFTEDSPYRPNSPYSATKAASDHLVRAYHHTYGLPVTTSNCSNNYGPRQHTEKFIPTIISACREQRPIPVYGDGSNVRDWLFVGDHCEAIDKVVRLGKVGETYNIGGNDERANIDVAQMICRTMDKLYPRPSSCLDLIQFVTDRPGHDWRYAIDSNKFAKCMAWQPRHQFNDGIIKTIKWYLGDG